jgi:hypothetical protein
MMDAMRFEMDASPSYACIYAYIAYCKLDRLAVVIKLKLLLQVSICILVFQADMEDSYSGYGIRDTNGDKAI